MKMFLSSDQVRQWDKAEYAESINGTKVAGSYERNLSNKGLYIAKGSKWNTI
jgi:hypothetical protein